CVATARARARATGLRRRRAEPGECLKCALAPRLTCTTRRGVKCPNEKIETEHLVAVSRRSHEHRRVRAAEAAVAAIRGSRHEPEGSRQSVRDRLAPGRP